MASGLRLELLLPAVTCGIVMVLLLRRTLPLPIVFPVVALKIALPIVYFAWFYDGTWTFLDDVTYIRQGKTLLSAGYDPFTIFFSRDGMGMLFGLAGGVHILYGWWNQLAQYLFGEHYYAAVFLNVVVTAVASDLLYRFARRGGFSIGYARGLQLFFLLHWEVLAWSSLINLKDILVLTLSLGALLLLEEAVDESRSRTARALSIAGVGLICFALLWIRFYAPALILAAFGGWILLRDRGFKKLLIVGVTVAAGVALIPAQLIPAGALRFQPVQIVIGAVRFLLTPQPWSIEPAYGFLLFPSILHWSLAIPALIGAVLLWRRTPLALLLLLYLGVVVFFYAAAPELQGVRQRLQIVFVLAWLQYHACYSLAARIAPRLDVATMPMRRAWSMTL